MNPPKAEHRDSLREGLVLLSQRLGRATTVAELGDGLALQQGLLPLELAPRALKRARLEARVLALPLEQVADKLLPALLVMADGSTLVLVEWRGKDAVLMLPESRGGSVVLDAEALRSKYTGKVIVAKPTFQPDDRAGEFARAADEHWLKGPLKKQWRTWLEVGVAALMANLLAVTTALFAMQVYDRVVPTAAYDTLWILASGVALAVVLEFILRSLRAYLLDVTGKKLDLQLSAMLFAQVMQIRLNAKPASTGAFSSQIREFESVREFFTSSTIGAISDLPFVLLFVGVIAYIGGPVAWVPVTVILLMLLPGLLAQGKLAQLSRQNLREGAIRQGVLLESIENLETVKATRAEGRNLRLWEFLSADLAEVGVRYRRLSSLLSHGATMIQQLGYVGVVVVGVYRIGDGAMTIGALIACTILASRTVSPMTQVAGILARWQHVKVAMEGLDELLNAPTERPDGRDFARKQHLRGHYQLDNLSLRLQQDGPLALDVKALEVMPGERIGLLGGNGAGKSTLLRVLAGLNDPSGGRVVLDNVNLAQIEPVDRRSAIGYLPQDIALFYGTLRENLLLDGAHHDETELFEALEAVGLGAFVRRHPIGMDMPIQGSGSVSGGQRQAIGLARLILQDPRIVLLDEPTSAFDQTNEAKVVNFLQHWLKGRTLIMATHKKSVLALVDRAVVLRDGRVLTDGPVSSVVSGNRVQTPAQRPVTVKGGAYG